MPLTVINDPMAPCRRCRRVTRFKRRGLCWRCYSLPSVRCVIAGRRFGTAAASFLPADFPWQGESPGGPLPGEPGSEERIRAMQRRALLGQRLFEGSERTFGLDDAPILRRLLERAG